MVSSQKSNEEINRVERTLEEETEISELAQIVAIFNDEETEAKRDYMEAKKELIRRIHSLNKMGEKVKSAITFQKNTLVVDNLIEKLNHLELQIKNSALAVEETDRYEFDEKRKRKVFRTEYFIKERGNNSRNSEEDRLLKFLNQKQEMVQELTIFVESFNGLNEVKRNLLYYSFFEREADLLVAERMGYAESTVKRLKKESVLQLLDTILETEVQSIFN